MYGFKRQFVPLILNGTKHFTIRGRRKFEDKPGDTMHLYFDARMPTQTLIARVPCISASVVHIPNRRAIYVEGRKLTAREIDVLIVQDGFTEFDQLMDFFESRFPFDGKKYEWTPLDRKREC